VVGNWGQRPNTTGEVMNLVRHGRGRYYEKPLSDNNSQPGKQKDIAFAGYDLKLAREDLKQPYGKAY
jgi:hypothetical protein